MAKDKTVDETPEAKPGAGLKGWLCFPLSLFPLVALLTYDWRSVEFLQTPPAPSANWIGLPGDFFAYWGYELFGLAIWIAPVFCVAAGLRACVSGRATLRPGMRAFWRLCLMASVSCLLQAMQGRAPGLDALLARFNLMAAGGIAGYTIMGKGLLPLFSGVGAAVIAVVAVALSAVGAIGAGAIARFFAGVWRWTTGVAREPESEEEAERRRAEEELAAAARAAKEEAKRQRQEEKRLMREKKLAEKRERELMKENAWREKQEQIEAERKAAEEAKLREEAAEARLARESQAAPPAGKKPAAPQSAAQVPEPQARAAADAAAAPENEAQEKPDKGPYVLPPVDLLDPRVKSTADHGDTSQAGAKLVETLKLFGIEASVSYTVEGPVVTKYALALAPGTRYEAVSSLSNNLKGALRARSIRIETPIPGEDCVGVEVPNPKPAGITFREIIESDAWKKFDASAEIPMLFGKDAAGRELLADLAKMPHMLVAGATGQGKSVCLNSIINGLLMSRTPEQLKLIMVDPKSVEFTPYASIPHLLVPVITDNKKVEYSLNWAVVEMEKRLKLFARHGKKNIYDYNHRKRETQLELLEGGGEKENGDPKTLPYIVIIIDEVADLMQTSGKQVTPTISRLTAKARAAGIHLILATQRPDAKIITGVIKSNIPGRVAFKTSQAIDSRTILDDAGAENLIGRGDMLFKGKDSLLVRAQGAWISDGEIERITDFIGQHSDTQFDEYFAKKLGRVKEAAIEDPFAANEDDPDNQPQAAAAEKAAQRLSVKAAAEADDFKKAIECIINTGRASTSHFQRQLNWGYNHSAKILDMLAARGIVSQLQGMGARQVTMDQEQLLAILNDDGGSAAAGAIAGGAQTGADSAEAGSADEGGGAPGEETGESDFEDNETEET